VIVACPICGTPLDVPAALVGKEVRCAVCEAVFPAHDPRRRRAARTPAGGDDRADRLRERRERALAQVAGPANALIATGWLGVALGLGVAVVGPLLALGPFGHHHGIDLFALAMPATAGVVMMCWGGILVSGATKLKHLVSYGYGMTGALAALVPCNPCWLLSAPLALWAVSVMNRDEVKENFP
jgi:hypothetical protein